MQKLVLVSKPIDKSIVVLILSMAIFSFLLSVMVNQRYSGFIGSVLNFVFLFISFFFAIGFVYSFYVTSTKPDMTVAILTDQGIELKRFGFIAWSNIEVIDDYRVATTPLRIIGIRFKNLMPVFKQASFAGKVDFFWAFLLKRNYHTFISNITVDNSDIIDFARRYID